MKMKSIPYMYGTMIEIPRAALLVKDKMAQADSSAFEGRKLF